MTEKSEDEGVLSPVPSVPSVPIVPKEGDKGDKGDKGDTGQDRLKLDSEFSGGRSEREKLAILYYSHPTGLTDTQAASELGVERESVKKYRQRLAEAGDVSPIGNERPQRFTLSDKGRAELDLQYSEWKRAQDEAKRREIALREANRDLSMQYLDLPATIEKWRELFDAPPYSVELHTQVRKGRPWIAVQFSDVARHSPELAEALLDHPEDTLKAAEIAIGKLNIPTVAEIPEPVVVRITGLPATMSVGVLHTRDLGRLVCVEAQVVTAGERRPQMTSARFECPACGNVIPVLQIDQKFQEPARCTCGRKGRFRILNKVMEDHLAVLVQQPIVELAGKAVRPSTLKVTLRRDLARPEVRDQLGLNRVVHVVGTLREVPVLLASGGQSTRMDWRLDANSVTVVEHYDPQLRLTPERIAEIKREAARPDFKERLRAAYFPDHVGDDDLCELLIAQSVAMPLHLHTPEARAQADREALHILLMTPPGMGKSRNLAGRLIELVPIRGRANGTGATRAGLTIGADLKDKDTDLVIPSPQALPNSNLGLFVFDETDKMDIREQPVLNEALSEHQVTVAKRGVNITLPAMICFLGLANPRTYDWDLSQETLQETLNVHYTLLTRCVTWVGRDDPKEERDARVALAILRRDELRERAYDDEFIRDYILLARATVVPAMRREHEELLADFYAKLRQIETRKTITPRFIEQARSLLLLHAKMHLRNETTTQDLRWANDLLLKQLLQAGFDPGRLPNTLPRMVNK